MAVWAFLAWIYKSSEYEGSFKVSGIEGGEEDEFENELCIEGGEEDEFENELCIEGGEEDEFENELCIERGEEDEFENELCIEGGEEDELNDESEDLETKNENSDEEVEI